MDRSVRKFDRVVMAADARTLTPAMPDQLVAESRYARPHNLVNQTYRDIRVNWLENRLDRLDDVRIALDDYAGVEIHPVDADEVTGAGYAIQGYDVRGLEAAYHVVEHLSWHAGQIVWIAKARGGAEHGIAFYDDEKLNADKNA